MIEYFYSWGHEQPHLQIINYCLSKTMRNKDSIYLEFGVWTGISANFIARIIHPQKLYGFDSFEGLTTSWGDLPEGYFKLDFVPGFPPNFILCKGFFSETIPKFNLEHKGKRVAFVNIDCDLSESTWEVLEDCLFKGNFIRPGLILYFDEFYKRDSRILDEEGETFSIWVQKHNINFRIIAISDHGGVAIEILREGDS